MFKDILTFLRLYYRIALFITFYFVVLRISIPKADQSDNYVIQKIDVKKVKNQHV